MILHIITVDLLNGVAIPAGLLRPPVREWGVPLTDMWLALNVPVQIISSAGAWG